MDRNPRRPRSPLSLRLRLIRLVVVVFSAAVVALGSSRVYGGLAQGLRDQQAAAVATEAGAARSDLANEFDQAIAGVRFIAGLADPRGSGFVLTREVAAVFRAYAHAAGDIAGLAIENDDGQTLWRLGSRVAPGVVAGFSQGLELGPLVAQGNALAEVVAIPEPGPTGVDVGTVLALVRLGVPEVSDPVVVTSTSASPILLVHGHARASAGLPEQPMADIEPLPGVGGAVGVVEPRNAQLGRTAASVVAGGLVIFALMVIGEVLLVQLAAYGEEGRIRSRLEAEATRLQQGIAEASWAAQSFEAFVAAVEQFLRERLEGLLSFGAALRGRDEELVISFGADTIELSARARSLPPGASVVESDGSGVALLRHAEGGEVMVARAVPGMAICPLAVLELFDPAVLGVALERVIASGERARMAHALESIATPVFLAEGSGVLTWTNSSLEELLGWSPGVNLGAVLGPEWRAIGASEDVRLLSRTGAQLWVRVELSEVTRDDSTWFVGVVEDRTSVRLETEQLTHQSTHDTLTGTLNRAALEAMVNREVESGDRERGMWLGVLDLDGFKPINDTFGHAVGDEVLRAVAHRLQAALRGLGEVGRFGGDEFVLVAHGFATFDALPPDLVSVFDHPIVLGEGYELRLEGSLGIARWPGDGATFDQLVRQADRALYFAKAAKGRRGRWWWFCDEISSEAAGLEDPFAPGAGRWLEAGGRLVGTTVQRLAARLVAQGCLDGCGVDLRGQDCLHAQLEVIGAVLAPAATPEVLIDPVRETGRRLALAGGTAADLETFTQEALTVMREQSAPGVLGERLVGIGRARLGWLSNVELAAMVDLRWQYLNTMLELPQPDGDSLVIWSRAVLEALAFLPGIQLGIVIATGEGGLEPCVEAVAPNGDVLAAWLSDEEQAGLVDPLRTIGPGDGQRAWREGRVMVVDDLFDDDRYAHYRDIASQLGVRSLAVCPIRLHGRPVGLVVLGGEFSGMFRAPMVMQFLDALVPSITRGFEALAERRAAPRQIDQEPPRVALSEGGLLTYVQPIVGLADGTVHQVELLARLRDRRGRVLGPDEFLGALGPEELSAVFLTQLTRAREELAVWRRYAPDLRVAVNVGASTLADPHVVDVLRAVAAEVGLGWLVLEVLESDSGRLTGVVEEFLARGARLAIDDLGSGFSNLERLVDLPLWEVKIDRSLVSRLRSAPTISTAVLAGLVQGAHDMDRLVVFEGVEGSDLVEAAGVLEADLVQGYHFAVPMPIREVTAWLDGRGPFTPSRALTTWVGAIAACWRESVVGPGLPSDDGQGCALAAFLDEQDGGGMLVRLHQRFHREGRVRSQTFRDLLAGLEARLEAETAARTPVAREE